MTLSFPAENIPLEVQQAITVAQDLERLAVLQHLDLLDSETEESFNRLTRLASRITNSPVSLVSLIDANRQFFKSQVGLPEPLATLRETPLNSSFCKHVVANNAPLVVEDARNHPFLKDNLAVRDLNVIGYLGMPLTTTDGVGLGSFCIIDTHPRQWTEREIEIMRDLAHLVMTEIEIRAQVKARLRAEAALQDHVESLESIVAERTRAIENANERLREVDQLKSKFIDDISHELRTPVTNINLYLGLLANGKSESREKYEGILTDQSGRLSTLLEGILEFSDLQKRLDDAQLERVDLNDIARQAATSLVFEIQESGLQFSVEAAANPVEVWGEPLQLQQVVIELVKNGLAYTPAGFINVSLDQMVETGDVRLTVEDSGMGMDEDEATHCFNRFYRGKRVGQLNQVSGSGLGLTLVRDIIAFHNGQVEVESAVDQGSRFSIILPTL